jgi:quercetin dioxygenase-like cupin family protein/ketosteroid isomerase-like protein
MAEDPRPFVSAPGDGRTVMNPVGGSLTFTARGELTGGALTAFESTAAPGEGPPLHRHANEDEVIYVLEGRLRVMLEGTVHDAPSGSFVFIPRGVPHPWQNAGDGPARFLALFTPAAGGMERFFERSAELGDDSRAADAFKKFASDAGMEVLGPPLAQSDTRPKRTAMSKNSELVLAGYEAWNHDDVDAWLETLHPDVEFRTSGLFPDFDPVYRGHEGVSEFWRRMHEPWEKFRIDIEEIDEQGDCFVLKLRFRGTGVDSGVEVDMRLGNAIRVRDGLVGEVVSQRTAEEAGEMLR